MDSFHLVDDEVQGLLPETMPDIAFSTLDNNVFSFGEEPANPMMFEQDEFVTAAPVAVPLVKVEQVEPFGLSDLPEEMGVPEPAAETEMSDDEEAYDSDQRNTDSAPPNTNEYHSSGSDHSGSSVTDVTDQSRQQKKGRKRKQTKLAAKLPPPQKPQENMTEEEKREFKRKQRLLRNRVSAQLSRERKKAYVNVLEDKMKEMVEQNKELSAKLNELAKQNAQLRQRLEKVEHSDNSSTGGSAAGREDSPIFYTVEEFGDAEDGSGPIKRYKAGSKGARAGLVLFALVFSFGIFFHINGVDIMAKGPQGRSVRLSDDMMITPGVFRGRVLQSIAESEDKDSSDQDLSLVAITGPGKAPSDGKGASSDVEMEEPDEDESVGTHLQPVHMSTLSKQLQDTIINIGLAMNETGAPSVGGHKVDAPAPVYIHGDPNSAAVQHYDEHRNSIHKALHDALDMYRSLYLKETNGTLDKNMPSSILFCPSAIHVHASDHSKAVAVHKTGPNTSLGSDASNMLLWVPSSSVSAGWMEALPRKRTAEHTKHGVTEMSLKVNGVREVIS